MRIVLSILLMVTLATPAHAQGEALAGDLALSPPSLAGEAADGIFPGMTGLVAVPWTLTFASPVAAAAELSQGAALALTLQCNIPLKAEPVTVTVPYTAGQAEYDGTAEVPIDASDVVGFTRAECTASGTFSGASTESTAESNGSLPIVFQPAVNVTAGATSLRAGPQKQMRYPIDVRNDGDARVVVRFELSGKAPGGKWAILLPDPVVVDPGQMEVAVITVATPFENGYNKEALDFTVTAVPSPVDEDVEGGRLVVPLHANVEGFYASGPSFGLALLGLAGAIGLLRRRAA
jgi:hypothetical protein